MSVAAFTKSGAKSTTAPKLPKDIFELDVENHELLKLAYEAYLSNGRTNVAKAKDRSEVRGGGRKPWAQKGTGRARHGSIRSPIWRTGGVTFGPQGNENYTKKITKKSKHKATRQALSLAAKDGELKVIESIDFKDGKTKEAVELLNKLGCDRNVLIVVEDKTDNLIRATRNLGEIKLVTANYLNVYSILNASHIIITKAAVEIVNKWLSEGSND